MIDLEKLTTRQLQKDPQGPNLYGSNKRQHLSV